MLCMCGPIYSKYFKFAFSELCAIVDRYCKIVEDIAKVLILKKIID